MDDQRARELLHSERTRVEKLLSDADSEGRSDREAADAHDGASDAGELLTAETTDNALAAALRDRPEPTGRSPTSASRPIPRRSSPSTRPKRLSSSVSDPPGQSLIHQRCRRRRARGMSKPLLSATMFLSYATRECALIER
jgi:hypothetical protein